MSRPSMPKAGSCSDYSSPHTKKFATNGTDRLLDDLREIEQNKIEESSGFQAWCFLSMSNFWSPLPVITSGYHYNWNSTNCKVLDIFESYDWFKCFVSVKFKGDREKITQVLQQFSCDVQRKAVMISILHFEKEDITYSDDIDQRIQVWSSTGWVMNPR